MKRIIITLGAVLALTACSSETDNADEQPSGPVPRSNVQLKPPIEFSSDPAEKQRQQEGLVNSMLEDPNIPFDQIEGEAYRRGVTLTPEQIAAKKAQKPAVNQPPPAEPAPPPAN